MPGHLLHAIERNTHLATQPQHAGQAGGREDPSRGLRGDERRPTLKRLEEVPTHGRLRFREQQGCQDQRSTEKYWVRLNQTLRGCCHGVFLANTRVSESIRFIVMTNNKKPPTQC